MTRLIAICGVVMISFSAIFVRLAAAPPTTAAFFRALYAVPALLALWWLQRRRDLRPWKARGLAFAAGFFLALDLAFWHRSIELIGAGLATVLSNTQVVFVGILAWILHRERPTASALLVIPMIFAGVVLISGLGRGDAYGADPLLGIAYGVLTGLTYTGFLLLLRRSNQALAPASGSILDATLGTVLGVLVIGLFDHHGIDFRPAWPAHGWLLALALGSQAVGWPLISTALPRLPALETSVMLLLQPTFTVLWALLLFDEWLSAVQWTGVVLVLAGVGWLSLRGSVRPTVQADDG